MTDHPLENTTNQADQPWRVHLHNALENFYSGQLESAVRILKHALASVPGNALLHHNLAVMLFKGGDPTNALHHFKQAASLDPCLTDAWIGCSQAALAMGRLDVALGACRQAVAGAPDNSRAHYNLATLYKNLEDYTNAERHYLKVIDLEPGDKAALNNLGVIGLETGDYKMAVAWFTKALAVDPGYVQSLYNLALAYKRQGKPDQALDSLRYCLQIQPDYPEALVLQVSLLQQLCAWDDLEVVQAKLEKLTSRQLNLGLRPVESPFLSFSRTPDPKRNFQIARAWAEDVAARAKPHVFGKKSKSNRKTKDKIVVGYLSEQFRNAATSHLMAALFDKHDRRRFQINAYSLGADDRSAYRKRIVTGVDHFVDLRHLTAPAAAGRIYADGVDILVDLIGWMHGHRITIPALRPAPIQVNYLGYPGTTGADFIDYILADRTVIPPEHQAFFKECVVYLPHCYQATDPNPPMSNSRITRGQCGLPDKAVVYCSFCTDYKIDRKIFNAWMEILAAIPGSVLWLLVRSEASAANLRKSALQAGIQPERLIFAPALPKDQHLERLVLADLALDTPIVNGHTTTTDALWAGVPVLTLQGSHFASRVASSLIRAMGLTPLVKSTLQEYVDFAIHLGLDNRQLKLLKQRVRRNRFHSALFDIHGFTNGLEAAYLRMWEIHLRGEPPRSFAVSNC